MSSSTLEPLKMAQNDEGNARKSLSDHVRPVLQRLVTRVHNPLIEVQILE